MERSEYNAQIAFVEYLQTDISEELGGLGIGEVENRLHQYETALNKVNELKNKCVDIMLKNDAERHEALDFSKLQRGVVKSLSDFKIELQATLKGLRLTEQQNIMKDQQVKEHEMSVFKENLEIERAKRVAENEQKINSALQTEITNSVEERQKVEQSYLEKMANIRHGANFVGIDGAKSHVKLQKLHMSPFTGDIVDFARFWPQFTTEIDKSNMNDISKFNYLIELCKGRPKNDILGLPHSSEGYLEAKRILQERYGKDTVVFKQLVFDLENLFPIRSMHQKREINEFYQKFSRIVRTLQTMDKLNSVEGFVHTIFKKLGPLRENLASNNENWEKWTLIDLSENLRKFVDRNNLNSDRSENENRLDRFTKDNERRPEHYNQSHRNYKDKTFYNAQK